MNKLKDIIEKGILIDLMKAERALSVFNVIAVNNAEITVKKTENSVRSDSLYGFLEGELHGGKRNIGKARQKGDKRGAGDPG